MRQHDHPTDDAQVVGVNLLRQGRRGDGAEAEVVYELNYLGGGGVAGDLGGVEAILNLA
jgi:hypothetical protein